MTKTAITLLLAITTYLPAMAAEFDPTAPCVIHVRKGETLVLPPWIEIRLTNGRVINQTLLCVDEGGRFVKWGEKYGSEARQ